MLKDLTFVKTICLPIFLKFYIIKKNNFFGSGLQLLASFRESALRQSVVGTDFIH